MKNLVLLRSWRQELSSNSKTSLAIDRFAQQLFVSNIEDGLLVVERLHFDDSEFEVEH